MSMLGYFLGAAVRPLTREEAERSTTTVEVVRIAAGQKEASPTPAHTQGKQPAPACKADAAGREGELIRSWIVVS